MASEPASALSRCPKALRSGLQQTLRSALVEERHGVAGDNAVELELAHGLAHGQPFPEAGPRAVHEGLEGGGVCRRQPLRCQPVPAVRGDVVAVFAPDGRVGRGAKTAGNSVTAAPLGDRLAVDHHTLDRLSRGRYAA